MELHDLFPDDEAAEQWFVEARWPGGKIRCPRCNGRQVRRSTHQTMPYRCRRCRRFFSVRTGTLMERSHIGYRQWAIAIYLMVTNIKGTSSMHLHRGSRDQPEVGLVHGTPDPQGMGAGAGTL